MAWACARLRRGVCDVKRSNWLSRERSNILIDSIPRALESARLPGSPSTGADQYFGCSGQERTGMRMPLTDAGGGGQARKGEGARGEAG